MAISGKMAGAVAVGMLAAIAMAGCAAPPAAAPMAAAADCPAALAGSPAGDWLLGRWGNSYYTLLVEQRDGGLRWTMSRVAHPSERWGHKASMTASGGFAELSPCSAEMTGYYDSSEDGYLPGKALIYRARWDGAAGMSGMLLGAGREWTPISFFRMP